MVLIASSTASESSSSFDVSEAFTNAVSIVDSLLLKALPATVTRDARALALNTLIGVAIKVGIKTGKTVLAWTYDN